MVSATADTLRESPPASTSPEYRISNDHPIALGDLSPTGERQTDRCWDSRCGAIVRCQLLPGTFRRVCPGRQHLHGITGDSRLVRTVEHLVLAGGPRGGRALLANRVHDVLAGAQALGLTPFGTHLVNLLLYMASVLLLWRLLRCLGVPGAWAVAAVFAVHPMHVDSVAWAIGRKDLLSGLFYMASALCWIRSVDGVEDGPGRSSGRLSFRTPDSTWRRWDCSPRRCCPSRWRSPCRSLSQSGSGGRTLA